MKKTQKKADTSEVGDLQPEYDFDYSRAKPNRFVGRMTRPVVAVVLEPDVAAVFKSSARVNAELRTLITARKRKRPVSPARQHRRRAS
ncbi:MAG: hypothetical protein JWL71_1295 [Acidobacteria bacterium]|nr:hypothetical protein [Acidobacteriota bacterium]